MEKKRNPGKEILEACFSDRKTRAGPGFCRLVILQGGER